MGFDERPCWMLQHSRRGLHLRMRHTHTVWPQILDDARWCSAIQVIYLLRLASKTAHPDIESYTHVTPLKTTAQDILEHTLHRFCVLYTTGKAWAYYGAHTWRWTKNAGYCGAAWQHNVHHVLVVHGCTEARIAAEKSASWPWSIWP